MATPVLGYWKVRGLAQPIRLLLAHTGTEYEDLHYECGPAPDFDRSTWTSVKQKLGLDFPNLPYYIDGDVKLTQSGAIIRYIARKHNLTGKTEEEFQRIDVLENQFKDFGKNWTNLCYSTDFDDLKDGYLKELQVALKQFSDYLGKHKFFAGKELTFVDFIAYELLYQHLAFKPDSLDQFPNLKKFQETIEALPKIAQYIKSGKGKLPFNNKSAKFNSE